MKTKRVSYWIDLFPGWQDGNYVQSPYTETMMNNNTKLQSNRRIEITVDLPCFGGSADTDQVLPALAREVQ